MPYVAIQLTGAVAFSYVYTQSGDSEREISKAQSKSASLHSLQGRHVRHPSPRSPSVFTFHLLKGRPPCTLVQTARPAPPHVRPPPQDPAP
jgi:hypothetical protein